MSSFLTPKMAEKIRGLVGDASGEVYVHFHAGLDAKSECICGENQAGIIPTQTHGCGLGILFWRDVYRCLNCGIPFHKACLKAHLHEEDRILREVGAEDRAEA